MWDFTVGRALGLMAKTLPFILLRMAVYFGAALLAEQILNNLLSNALKYSPESEPVFIRISARNRQISFAVRDSGVGLSIASQMAKLLGGELACVSHAGLGSTFTLNLPIEWAPLNAEGDVQHSVA